MVVAVVGGVVGGVGGGGAVTGSRPVGLIQRPPAWHRAPQHTGSPAPRRTAGGALVQAWGLFLKRTSRWELQALAIGRVYLRSCVPGRVCVGSLS